MSCLKNVSKCRWGSPRWRIFGLGVCRSNCRHRAHRLSGGADRGRHVSRRTVQPRNAQGETVRRSAAIGGRRGPGGAVCRPHPRSARRRRASRRNRIWCSSPGIRSRPEACGPFPGGHRRRTASSNSKDRPTWWWKSSATGRSRKTPGGCPSRTSAGVVEFWLIDARGEHLQFQIHRRGARRFEPVASGRDGGQRSALFGKRFRLERQRNRMGHWRYQLYASR